MTTPRGVLVALVRRPGELLLRRWNWKSAAYSSTLRAAIFFFANLKSGAHAAENAMLAEFAYRAVTAGFYGSITQAFRRVEPAWRGNAYALGLMVALSHSIEFVVHYLRGTPHLRTSIIASMIFTLISTLFNLHAMRRGAFVTDRESNSFADDLRRVPVLIGTFLWSGPRALIGVAFPKRLVTQS